MTLPKWLTDTLLLGGVLFALLAQYTLRSDFRLGALWYIIALSLWTFPLFFLQAPPERQSTGIQSGGRGHWGWLLAALACSLLTFNLAWEGFFSVGLLLLWALAVGTWLLFWGGAPSWKINTQKLWEAGAVLALCLVGGVALFHDLDALPRDMISDHVENVLDVNRVLGGEYDIYFGNNSGREPLFFYMAAFFAWLDHPTFIVLKMSSAVFALLTLPVYYGLGRVLGDRLTGFVALCLGAVNSWHLIMGRLGFRVALSGLAAGLLLLLLARALRHGRRFDFLLVGVVLGAGMYGYSTFRIAPLLVLVGLGLAWWADRAAWRALLAHALALAVVALAVYLPLLAFWARYPDVYWYRTAALTDAGSIGWADYLRGLAETLFMFNFLPDPVPLNVISTEQPVLGWVMGALFLLGFLAWVVRAAKGRDPLLWLVPLAFLVFVLPSALGIARPQEMPSARRALMALPVVILLAADGLVLVARRLRPAHWGAALLVGVLLLNAGVELHAYFDTYRAHYPRRVERAVGAFIRSLEKEDDISNLFIIYGGGWLDPRSVAVWIDKPGWDNVLTHIEPGACLPRRQAEAPVMALVQAGDEENLLVLRQCYADYELVTYNFDNVDTFWYFRAESLVYD